MNLKTIQNVSRKALYGLVGGMMAAGLWSCSSDEPTPGLPETSQGDVYANLTLSLPTRSNTTTDGESDAGVEIGKDYENNVGSVLVILMSPDNSKFVTSSFTDALQGSNDDSFSPNPARPTYSIRFESLALAKYIDENGLNVNVYAVCNPTQDILNVALAKYDENGAPTNTVADNVLDQIVALEESYNTGDSQSIYWRNKAFVMSSAHKLPFNGSEYTYDKIVKEHNTPAKALDLGTVDVKRVSARFDFASTTVDNTLGANVYPIKSLADGSLMATVTVDGLALVNVAKQFYVFPRVSPDGTDNAWELLGSETSSNYVVSPFFAEKKAFESKNGAASWLATPVTETLDAGKLAFTRVADIISGTEDNPDNWTNTDNKDYRIWRYATENTIPSIGQQKNGITTGIVFRALITAAEGTDLANAMNALKKVYAYEGTVYGDLTMLVKAANKNIGSPLYNAVKDNFSATVNTENGELTVAADLEKSNDTFDVYAPDNEGNYYTYYWYWNRHNDNIDPNTMGAMEFGVVRNNVYKLAVTNIKNFGQPGDKPNKPDDPDEKPHAYFQVSVRVMPWIVRINNIEF